MARKELTDEQWKKLTDGINSERDELKKNEKDLKHQLKKYNEGNFNNHDVIIVELLNRLGLKKYIVPTDSQISMRTQYYWINGINEYLENGLNQDRLIILEDFQEIQLNMNGTNETYLVYKTLL